MSDSSIPENRVIITEDLRAMEVPNNEIILGCAGDANVRRVYFEIPRYCDGTDLNGYSLSVNFRNSDDDEDRYPVVDAVAGEETITFSWLVGAIACAYPGLTAVSIKAQNLDGDEIENEFNSTIKYFRVLPANNSGAAPIEQYTDAFTALVLQWQAQVDAAAASMSGEFIENAVSNWLDDNPDAIDARVSAYIAANMGTIASAVSDWLGDHPDVIDARIAAYLAANMVAITNAEIDMITS